MSARQLPRQTEEAAIAAWLAEHQAITQMPAQPRPMAPAPTGPGRPRKSGERYECGKLFVEPDGGTAEHQAKRQKLAGPPRDTRTPQRIRRHEALASYPLGVLYARRLVLSGEHYAGRRYASLFVKAVRPVTIPCILANLIAAGGLPLALAAIDETVEHGAEDRAAYLAARETLDGRGPLVAKAIDELVIYEHAPRTQRRLELIRDGLDALKAHFERVDELAAGTRG